MEHYWLYNYKTMMLCTYLDDDNDDNDNNGIYDHHQSWS